MVSTNQLSFGYETWWLSADYEGEITAVILCYAAASASRAHLSRRSRDIRATNKYVVTL